MSRYIWLSYPLTMDGPRPPAIPGPRADRPVHGRPGRRQRADSPRGQSHGHARRLALSRGARGRADYRLPPGRVDLHPAAGGRLKARRRDGGDARAICSRLPGGCRRPTWPCSALATARCGEPIRSASARAVPGSASNRPAGCDRLAPSSRHGHGCAVGRRHRLPGAHHVGPQRIARRRRPAFPHHRRNGPGSRPRPDLSRSASIPGWCKEWTAGRARSWECSPRRSKPMLEDTYGHSPDSQDVRPGRRLRRRLRQGARAENRCGWGSSAPAA